MERDIDLVVHAYIECMIWADRPEEDLRVARGTSEQLRKQAREDVEDFLGLLKREGVQGFGWSDIQLGHDFWLSRQGHGTGFWDRGFAEGETLHKWAKTYSSRSLYVGDDGLYYCQ